MKIILLGMEEKLNQLDSGSGDGDCGSTLAAGAKGTQTAPLEGIVCFGDF
jgi:hypothetical protein